MKRIADKKIIPYFCLIVFAIVWAIATIFHYPLFQKKEEPRALLTPTSGDSMNAPRYLYKIVSLSEWERSQREKDLLLSDIDVAFIHLATKEQLKNITEKYWKGTPYLILKIDATRLLGELRYEVNRGGSHNYYHLYGGSIPIEAVVEVAKNQP